MNNPGEIIVIQIGQCGNRLGTKFWEIVSEEHGIDPTGSYHGDSYQQLEKINVFFKAVNGGRFVPRAVVVDLKPDTMDRVRAEPYGLLFQPDNFVFGQTGAGDNYAKGFYTEGGELIDTVLDVVRKEAGESINLQGFIIIHSIGGGTGSGMGSLLISKLREEFFDKSIATFSVFPSEYTKDAVLAPYNATWAMTHLVTNTDLVFCLDNEAAFHILRQLGSRPPTNGDINRFMAEALSDITAPLRFPSKGTNCLSTLQEMVDKLVPKEPNELQSNPLHFISVALIPVGWSRFITPSSLNQLFTDESILIHGNSDKSKYLSVVGLLRGQEEHLLVDSFKRSFTNNQEGVTKSLEIIEIPMPRKNTPMGAALIMNNTVVQEMMKRIAEQFTMRFRRKMFLDRYTGEGMNEIEFAEAESHFRDLIIAYQTKEQSRDLDELKKRSVDELADDLSVPFD